MHTNGKLPGGEVLTMHTTLHRLRGEFGRLVILSVIGSLCTANLSALFMNSSVAHAIGPITCTTSELNISGHQDDDILFMNPDISDSIARKRCVETVYVTAGEWNGTSTMTREQYAASRNNGARAAYAKMANVANIWTRSPTTINGYKIEVATLNAAPNIKQIYLNLRDANDSIAPSSLQDLYTGARATVTTIVPTGSPAGIDMSQYTNAQLSMTLFAIMSTYRATLIRTQDYLPDQRLFGDHPDHVYGALFAVTAARGYLGVNNDLHVSLVTYRDYDSTNSPINLSATQAANKNAIIYAYKAYDPIFALPADQTVIASRMYYRWPVAPTWVTANQDGTLQAFDIQSGHLMTWHQNANGTWGSMQNLGNSSLQPGIGVGRNTDGTLQVFAIKQTINSQGAVQQDLQYTKQTTPNGAFAAWVNLGNPGPSSSGRYDIGSPSVVANADGRLEVFLKDSNGNLATIVQQVAPVGSFSAWIGLGGNGNLMETPATLLRADDGRIEIYSATRGAVYHWFQGSPNSSVTFDTAFGVAAQAVGTPSAGFNQDGRPEIFYRRAGDGTVYTAVQTGGGSWSATEFNLLSQSSQGAPAVVNTKPIFTTGSLIRLIARTPTAFETVAQAADNSSFAFPWVAVGSYTQHAPASILDSQNHVHFLFITQDGVLGDTTPL